MRVALDCRSVFDGAGGIGRSTAELARELPRHLGADDSLVLLLGARRPSGALAQDPRVQVAATDASMIDPVFEQVHLPALLRQLEVDLVHMTCFTTPIAAHRLARVSTVHDVVFRRHPDLVDPALRDYLDHWTGVSCRLADAVVTVSRFSRDEIAACYGRSEEVAVVPNGVSPQFVQLRRQRRDDAPPFLLYVGSLEPKKGISSLLRAFRRLLELAPELPHLLVLAGGGGGQAFDLEQALTEAGPARERVQVLGHVPEAHLDALYAQADAFLYLSRYEGFGLPPLEAMAAGVPTLVSDRSSLPEVVGDGALVVDPARPRAIARTLLELLRDPARQAELIRLGKQRAREFTWQDATRRLVEVYRLAAERRDRRLATAPEPVLAGGAT